MDMNRKIERAKEALNLITRADDNPPEEFRAAMAELTAHINAEVAAREARIEASAQEAGSA